MHRNFKYVLLHTKKIPKLNHKFIILKYIYKLLTIKQVVVTLENYWSLSFPYGGV